MKGQRLLKLGNRKDGLEVLIPWRVRTPCQEAVEPLEIIYKDVPGLQKNLPARTRYFPDQAWKARRAIPLPGGGV